MSWPTRTSECSGEACDVSVSAATLSASVPDFIMVARYLSSLDILPLLSASKRATSASSSACACFLSASTSSSAAWSGSAALLCLRRGLSLGSASCQATPSPSSATSWLRLPERGLCVA
ncbi:uncharacterized protein IUM83_14958 [Phytophthora cinnamomi]|uniref:uncharacterized protein n=1 Tax=Phytophthora cinnamomi TaxID=4785 RepID=UPI0035599151|nr:hypothetical protein IUM83_14958 [Phytophthora cinnamomi]